ncbi:DUF3299 domain-containing protein, partial [Vibrio natriegens]
VVYLIGTLKTQSINHELAQVGYMLEGTRIEAYDDM